MIVRTPLTPCTSASQSISRSQVCQNGLDHLPPTKAKSMALMPWPSMRFTNRWPNTRASSTTPLPRMKTHEYSSKLLRVARLRRNGVRGASVKEDVDMAAPSAEDVHQVADGERHEQQHPQGDDAPQHLP